MFCVQLMPFGSLWRCIQMVIMIIINAEAYRQIVRVKDISDRQSFCFWAALFVLLWDAPEQLAQHPPHFLFPCLRQLAELAQEALVEDLLPEVLAEHAPQQLLQILTLGILLKSFKDRRSLLRLHLGANIFEELLIQGECSLRGVRLPQGLLHFHSNHSHQIVQAIGGQVLDEQTRSALAQRPNPQQARAGNSIQHTFGQTVNHFQEESVALLRRQVHQHQKDLQRQHLLEDDFLHHSVDFECRGLPDEFVAQPRLLDNLRFFNIPRTLVRESAHAAKEAVSIPEEVEALHRFQGGLYRQERVRSHEGAFSTICDAIIQITFFFNIQLNQCAIFGLLKMPKYIFIRRNDCKFNMDQVDLKYELFKDMNSQWSYTIIFIISFFKPNLRVLFYFCLELCYYL